MEFRELRDNLELHNLLYNRVIKIIKTDWYYYHKDFANNEIRQKIDEELEDDYVDTMSRQAIVLKFNEYNDLTTRKSNDKNIKALHDFHFYRGEIDKDLNLCLFVTSESYTDIKTSLIAREFDFTEVITHEYS